eukprot:6743044-Pyramimonas_sp.AAC.1
MCTEYHATALSRYCVKPHTSRLCYSASITIMRARQPVDPTESQVSSARRVVLLTSPKLQLGLDTDVRCPQIIGGKSCILRRLNHILRA